MAKTKEEARLKKKEYDKKRREDLKKDPRKLEELKEKERLKYLNKKAKKQVKSVSEMSSREHRTKKKQWKQNSKCYRARIRQNSKLQQHLNANSPPDSDEENAEPSVNPDQVNNANKMDRKSVGRKKVRRDRSKMYKDNQKLKEQLKISKARAERYKKRYQSLKTKTQNSQHPLTPNSKVRKLLGNERVSPVIRKRLLFGEVLNEEVSSSFKKLKESQKGRKLFFHVIKGRILKKYRLLNYGNLMRSRTLLKNENSTDGNNSFTLKCQSRGRFVSNKTRSDVIYFYERDDNSKMCPGKKDTVTKNKLRKQKRILIENLKVLHEKFVSEVEYKLSYSTFAKLRPFWVVEPKLEDRNTCACILHVNTTILVKTLGGLGILEQKRPSSLLEVLCCDKNRLSCLQRTCNKCKYNTLHYDLQNKDGEIRIKKWFNETSYVNIKGTEKKIVKPIKKEISTTPRTLMIELEMVLPKYMNHVGNIIHQFIELKNVKENLGDESAFIHVDFSENYACKYNEEIQAVHFGGGRQQISLHTGVLYITDEEKDKEGNLVIKSKSFCSVSSSLRHDTVAVWAHLKPIFQWAFKLNPNLKYIHMQSDGVVSQYKNKTMFYIIAKKLQHFLPNLQVFTWNYSESGHGKGAPDGIGGTLKRTADKKVSHGKDVENLAQLLSVFKEDCKGVTIFEVTEEDIKIVENVLCINSKELKPFPGTLKVHQVVYNSTWQNLHFRSLSCFSCINKECDKFSMEKYSEQENQTSENVESISEDPIELRTIPNKGTVYFEI